MQKILNKRIAFITSTPMSIKVFLEEHIKYLCKFYDITVITSYDKKYINLLKNFPKNVRFKFININRNINLLFDLMAFFQLLFFLKSNKFDLVHSITPKAGFLSVITSRLSRVPNIFHTFTGQVWLSRKGFVRLFLIIVDYFIATLATRIIVDSHSQRKFLIKKKIITKKNSIVIGNGSLSGVDIRKFKRNNKIRVIFRRKLNFSKNNFVLLFIGRLNKDKGILDLANVFLNLFEKYNNLRLLFVGPDENNLKFEIKKILKNKKKFVKFFSFSNNPEYFMNASDLLVLPSYREGFGSVIIEASACGLPSVASNIYGIVDAIDDKNTGLLFKPGNVTDISNTISNLINNKSYRMRLGKNASVRARKLFNKKYLIILSKKLYESVLPLS
jgi:glycosyltransferase involved in cell wall biosynthesis